MAKIDLSGAEPFRRGRNRDCYRHPQSGAKCIKVRAPSDRSPGRKLASRLHHRIIELTGWFDFNAAELRHHRRVREALKGYVPEYFGIQETSLGPGLVVELVRDWDGVPSITLAEYLDRHDKIRDPGLWLRFEALFERLRQNHILLYDFNLLNIVLRRERDGAFSPVLVDLKSLNSKRTLVQLAGWSKDQARRKLDRRIERFARRVCALASLGPVLADLAEWTAPWAAGLAA